MSNEMCDGGTGRELAPPLLTSPWRRLLLIMAGDVEMNPGPSYDHGEKHNTVNTDTLKTTFTINKAFALM